MLRKENRGLVFGFILFGLVIMASRIGLGVILDPRIGVFGGLPKAAHADDVCEAVTVFRGYQMMQMGDGLGDVEYRLRSDHLLELALVQLWTMASERIRSGMILGCIGTGPNEVELIDWMDKVIKYYGLPPGAPPFDPELLDMARAHAEPRQVEKM